MTQTAGPQKSDDSPPTAAFCSMPQQLEPSMGNAPEGTTRGHPSPTGTTLDQDRETMRPPPPRPPQRRNTNPFDDGELRAVYGIQANAPSSRLVAALREHLQDVNPNRLFAVVPLPHAATTDIFVRQLQALFTPGTQIADDLVAAWIWWFNANQPDQPDQTDHGRRMGPTPGLCTHAHSATDGPQAPAQHRGPGTGCPATKGQHPQHPTAVRPVRMGKQDSSR